MVLDRRTVERRLAELDNVVAELRVQEGEAVDAHELEGDISRRWRLERGLLAAANLILDVASHVTTGHFASHPATYEESLRELATHGVIADTTYGILRGLGGFRNVLAHEYIEIDLQEIVRWRARLLEAAPSVIREVAGWLEELP